MDNKIIIFGSDHHNTLGVIRSFFYKGIKPNVVVKCPDPPKSFIIKSKHIDEGAAFATYEECLYFIKKKYYDENNKTIMIITADGAESLVDKNYDELSKGFFLPCSYQQGRVTELMNKETMSKLASECGLTVAQTWITKNGQVIGGPLVYPCITKSMLSISGGKDNIAILNNDEDLRIFFSNEKHSKDIQIQRFVDKKFEFQFIGLSLAGGAEIIIPGRTIIQHIVRENTSFLEFNQCDDSFSDTLDLCKKFIKETGYSGFFSVEFLRGIDDVDYFMEINFRNDGNAICATAAGTNLPYIWYLYHSGGDYKQELKNSYVKQIYLMPEFADFYNVLKKQIKFTDWLKDIKKANCYITYYKEDTRPFWILFSQTVSFLFKRVFKIG